MFQLTLELPKAYDWEEHAGLRMSMRLVTVFRGKNSFGAITPQRWFWLPKMKARNFTGTLDFKKPQCKALDLSKLQVQSHFPLSVLLQVLFQWR